MNATPTTFDRLAEAMAKEWWNKKADEFNQWSELDAEERSIQITLAARKLSALLRALPTLGLKLVPVEATQETIAGVWPHSRSIYRIMVASAPDILGENPHA